MNYKKILALFLMLSVLFTAMSCKKNSDDGADKNGNDTESSGNTEDGGNTENGGGTEDGGNTENGSGTEDGGGTEDEDDKVIELPPINI